MPINKPLLSTRVYKKVMCIYGTKCGFRATQFIKIKRINTITNILKYKGTNAKRKLALLPIFRLSA
jgi:hypothetical protein